MLAHMTSFGTDSIARCWDRSGASCTGRSLFNLNSFDGFTQSLIVSFPISGLTTLAA